MGRQEEWPARRRRAQVNAGTSRKGKENGRCIFETLERLAPGRHLNANTYYDIGVYGCGTYLHTNAYAYKYTNAHSYPYTHTNAYSDTNTHSYPYTYSNANTCAYTNTDAHSFTGVRGGFLGYR